MRSAVRSCSTREPLREGNCLLNMASSRQKSTTDLTGKQPNDAHSTLAKSLAPEEICRGDFVTPLHEIHELPSFYWCDDASLLPRDQLVRIQAVPVGESLPLKVKSICLPFVLVKSPRGEQRTLDLRKCRLARLDRSYAATAWKAYKKKSRSHR